MLRTLIMLAALTACGPDETVTAYAANEGVYQLSSIDGNAFTASATIDLRTSGTISGQAPCNSYNASQTAPYPWIEIGPIAATRRACPDLNAESHFLKTLASMTLVEVSGDTLILSNDAKSEMIFHASP